MPEVMQLSCSFLMKCLLHQMAISVKPDLLETDQYRAHDYILDVCQPFLLESTAGEVFIHEDAQGVLVGVIEIGQRRNGQIEIAG